MLNLILAQFCAFVYLNLIALVVRGFMSADACTEYLRQQQTPPEFIFRRCLYSLLEVLVAVSLHDVRSLVRTAHTVTVNSLTVSID